MSGARVRETSEGPTGSAGVSPRTGSAGVSPRTGSAGVSPVPGDRVADIGTSERGGEYPALPGLWTNPTSGAGAGNRVQYGETVIAYDVAYAPRKTVAITVAPDLRVSVTAPLGATSDAVAARVRLRAPWILRQRRELERYLPARPPRLYVSGATHLYLGRQYRLKVVEDPREAVKLARGRLYVWTPDRADTARIKGLLDAWYHTQASRVFRERLRALVPPFQQFGVAPPELAIKPLQARWGSCTGAGTITLNLALIQASKQHIDYVIVHELSHLVEHNHGKRFYQLLDRMLPAWRERRRQLNELSIG